MLLNIVKSGEQDLECSLEWLVNAGPCYCFRVSTADLNGYRDSRSSRPTTSSTTLAWSEPPSRMSRGLSGVGLRETSALTHHSSASTQQPSVTPSPGIENTQAMFHLFLFAV